MWSILMAGWLIREQSNKLNSLFNLDYLIEVERSMKAIIPDSEEDKWDHVRQTLRDIYKKEDIKTQDKNHKEA